MSLTKSAGNEKEMKIFVDAIKDHVYDCNFNCSDSGIDLQTMDNSQIALVPIVLQAVGFLPYHCDRKLTHGISLTTLTKILRYTGDEDTLALKAKNNPHTMNLILESFGIEASKECIKFSSGGNIGSESVTLYHNNNAEKPWLSTTIELTESVALTFSLKHLSIHTCNTTALSYTVTLSVSNEVHLLSGFTRFYLTSKITEEEQKGYLA
ncbi:proliferating cell nuclear antigen [Choiromyces venosus 120613-1]|uniref:Proliferating cell nuclear antigen n=1 Tax=Choiromyces venosus 120613-1 TaxID=1336337 RepID=A0A3N4JCN4_9PEZI|nr:proliferating cell nuclear antigen [Choiromyces venosus 120613-1]